MSKFLLLEESKQTFDYLSRSIIREKWLSNYKINDNYYYGNQWNNTQQKELLLKIGCKPITVNRIKPILDRYLSILIKSGKTAGFLPTNSSDYQTKQATNVKNWAFNVLTANNHTFKSSQKSLSSLSSGLGWSHFGYENNSFVYNVVDPVEMYPDPDDLSIRLENQNIIARSYFVNSIRLKQIYPKFKSTFDYLLDTDNKNIRYENFIETPSNVWVNGKSIRIVELYSKKNEDYYQGLYSIQKLNNPKNQLDISFPESDDIIFNTFDEELLKQENINNITKKQGSRIYKTVFCDNDILFHGPIKEQIPNQKYFPYIPMVYSRDIKGNFLGVSNHMIDLQDLWNTEISRLFHYSDSKLMVVNNKGTSVDFEQLLNHFKIESRKKRGLLQFDPKEVNIVDNSNDMNGILKSLDMINREFQNISGLFDDFAGKPTNAESGIAIQTRVNTTFNAQNPLVLAYEYMLTSEGRLMFDTLKGVKNYSESYSYFENGKQETSNLDKNIAYLNFDVYPTTTHNFSSSIEEERAIFSNIISSGVADILLSSPIFLQQQGISEITSYKLANEYKRILLEKMQLQQGIMPSNNGETNE